MRVSNLRRFGDSLVDVTRLLAGSTADVDANGDVRIWIRTGEGAPAFQATIRRADYDTLLKWVEAGAQTS